MARESASPSWYANINPFTVFLTVTFITSMMIIGIVFMGLAEAFISPRYLEYLSLQAPKGEEALYLSFSHLHSFLSSLLGSGLSGYLLNNYCPDPRKFSSYDAWQQAAQNAHYIWYFFAATGLLSAISFIIYGQIFKHIDKKTVDKNIFLLANKMI
jgi:hypothetical protein